MVGMASMLAANCSAPSSDAAAAMGFADADIAPYQVPITSVVLAVELAGGASYEVGLRTPGQPGAFCSSSGHLAADHGDRRGALRQIASCGERNGFVSRDEMRSQQSCCQRCWMVWTEMRH